MQHFRLAVLLGVLAIVGCSEGPTSTVPQLNPLPGARLTSAFGVRTHDPVTGKLLVDGHHDGYDLAAPMGTPIHAAKSGRVVFAGMKGGYGNAVILAHADGWSTLYGHASKLVVKPGDMVSAGQVIAYVGSTGHSTGPHLHYELRHDGVAVDPALSLASSAPALHPRSKTSHKLARTRGSKTARRLVLASRTKKLAHKSTSSRKLARKHGKPVHVALKP